MFGSLLKVNVDEQGDLTSVNGYAAPDLSLSTTPRLSATDAGERASSPSRPSPPARHPRRPT